MVKPYTGNPKEALPPIGHNAGQINEAAVALFVEYEQHDDNKREIAKAQRDIRARAKDQFGIQANVFSDQIRKRKMDADVRAQFEHGVKDLESMIGYQMSMNLGGPEDEEEDEDGMESVGADGADDLQAAGVTH